MWAQSRVAHHETFINDIWGNFMDQTPLETGDFGFWRPWSLFGFWQVCRSCFMLKLGQIEIMKRPSYILEGIGPEWSIIQGYSRILSQCKGISMNTHSDSHWHQAHSVNRILRQRPWPTPLLNCCDRWGWIKIRVSLRSKLHTELSQNGYGNY